MSKHDEKNKNISGWTVCGDCGHKYMGSCINCEENKEIKIMLRDEIDWFTSAPGFSWNPDKLAKHLSEIFTIKNKF